MRILIFMKNYLLISIAIVAIWLMFPILLLVPILDKGIRRSLSTNEPNIIPNFVKEKEEASV